VSETETGSVGLKEATLHGLFRVWDRLSVWVERKKA